MNTSTNTKSALHRLMWITNAKQFFPDKSVDDCWDGYLQWNRNRSTYAELYQQYDMSRLQAEMTNSPASLFNNGILITFHFGPYRLLPRYLVAMGIRLSILASSDVIDREKNWYAPKLEEANIPTDRLEFIDAGSTMVFRKMVQAHTHGRLILVYLDANEGQIHNPNSDSLDKIKIPFGAHHFYWRTNILKFALRYHIKVGVTYLNKHTENQSWQIADIIPVLNDFKEKDSWQAAYAVESLQDTFQQMMRQDWVAWENWAYIHVYNEAYPFVAKPLSAKGSWFIPLVINGKNYLYDINSYQFFKIQSKK